MKNNKFCKLLLRPQTSIMLSMLNKTNDQITFTLQFVTT
jgi:hypothetical protein